jgi:hypothetical protein
MYHNITPIAAENGKETVDDSLAELDPVRRRHHTNQEILVGI